MCVAIYKPEGVETPSLATLKKCWEANPDGAGFALRTDDEKYAIEIHKGYMTWQAFEAAFIKYHLADVAGDMLLHFRIATHGGISPGNTHPFSLTGDIKLLKHTNVLTNYALIHNGMFPIKPEGDISDTMEFCRIFAPLCRDIPAVLHLLTDFIGGNKLAVMTKDGVHLAGDWEKIAGVYYSNTLWQLPALNWDWHDELFYPNPAELSLLRKNICPNCDGEVIKEQSEFYCLGCDAIWAAKARKYAF